MGRPKFSRNRGGRPSRPESRTVAAPSQDDVEIPLARAKSFRSQRPGRPRPVFKPTPSKSSRLEIQQSSSERPKTPAVLPPIQLKAKETPTQEVKEQKKLDEEELKN